MLLIIIISARIGMSSRYKFACPRSAKVSIISVYKTVKSRLPERTVDRTGRAADMTHQTCAMWRWAGRTEPLAPGAAHRRGCRHIHNTSIA